MTTDVFEFLKLSPYEKRDGSNLKILRQFM